MKRFLLLLSAIFLTNIAFCQDEVKVSDDEAIFFVVEVQPEFPGGMDSMYAFIQKTLFIPKKQKQKALKDEFSLPSQ